jgi:hypothetical protein
MSNILTMPVPIVVENHLSDCSVSRTDKSQSTTPSMYLKYNWHTKAAQFYEFNQAADAILGIASSRVHGRWTYEGLKCRTTLLHPTSYFVRDLLTRGLFTSTDSSLSSVVVETSSLSSREPQQSNVCEAGAVNAGLLEATWYNEFAIIQVGNIFPQRIYSAMHLAKPEGLKNDKNRPTGSPRSTLEVPEQWSGIFSDLAGDSVLHPATTYELFLCFTHYHRVFYDD